MLALLLTLSLMGPIVAEPAPAPSGLVLEVAAPPPTKVRLPVALDIRLVNRGPKATWVVKPGDGSEVGWREPWVWFEAEHRTASGAWEKLPTPQLGRCGLYDSNWEKDALALAPGASITIKDWMPDVMQAFQMKPGIYRVVVHYAFRGGATKGHIPAPGPRRVMVDVAPFEVVSAPVEITIIDWR
jgi:hypothetical protein